MGYFGSEGIYDSNLSFWGKKFKKNFGPNATSGECTIYRVESKIADAICKNPRLTKIGMKFEFKDVLNR